MQINNEHQLINELELQLNALRTGIAERKKKIKVINKQLNTLKGTEGFPWTEKSLECIKSFDGLVSTDEILKCAFHNRLKDLDNSDERRGYITALSVALNKLCKNGKLKSQKHFGLRGLFYGLPEWWDDKGELMAYYKYKLENKKMKIAKNK